MLRTLIVDDEKLVRQGLIVTMPWNKFGMRVAGEANNGRTALAFMEHNEIDLLVTDLTMPIMDGLELMRTVRMLYPRVWIIVLTCHQDFSFIQEALRIGAIDYIVKTQLDLEGIEAVLARVAGRIQQEQSNRSLSGSARHDDYFDHGWVVAHMTCDINHAFFEQWQAKEQIPVLEAGGQAWFLPAARIDEEVHTRSFSSLPPGWVTVRLDGLGGNSLPFIAEWIRKNFHEIMFYEYEHGKKYYELPFSTLFDKDNVKLSHEWSSQKDKWLSMGWVFDDVSFAELCTSTAQVKPPKAALTEVIQASSGYWGDIVHNTDISDMMDGLQDLENWQSYVSRLKAVRNLIGVAARGLPFSSEIIICIVKAIRHIHGTNFKLSRDDAAAMVHMSSGYFSQCFKEITGKPFGDYLQLLQIARAKTLLRCTKQPISWIAEQSGYLDGSYFCRIFRKNVGVNPADYRRTFKESVTNS